jgi:hypothetical protein
MQDWKEKPSLETFIKDYYNPISKHIGVVFNQSGEDFYSVLDDLNWDIYRSEVLQLNPKQEESRLLKQIQQVETLFELTLEGDAILFGAFTCMDGYARFDCGSHQVFLGVDESHGRGAYLDVLVAHELTHVARESRTRVWEGFGLNPKMTHDEFTENLPVIEHVFGEGFSCYISELLVPGEAPWHYAYQTKDSLLKVLERGPAVDREVRNEIMDPNGDYGRLYQPSRYGIGMPAFTHYVWAWQWVKNLCLSYGNSNLKDILNRPSSEFFDHACQFELK